MVRGGRSSSAPARRPAAERAFPSLAHKIQHFTPRAWVIYFCGQSVCVQRGRGRQQGGEDEIATGVMTRERVVSAAEERRVIVASSVGTVFEWYDFYLYAILAPFFAGLFFPPGNQTAALLGAFGAYAAGFLIRPFGALIFGRIGDIVGRKYTFLVTIVVMGVSTM